MAAVTPVSLDLLFIASRALVVVADTITVVLDTPDLINTRCMFRRVTVLNSG